jgi:hypothetical protein
MLCRNGKYGVWNESLWSGNDFMCTGMAEKMGGEEIRVLSVRGSNGFGGMIVYM